MRNVLERQFETAVGYKAAVVLIRGEHLCGYVAVPETHPFFGGDYEDVDCCVRVHGGLTFSNECHWLDTEGGWWFGFDCAHCGDTLEKCNVDYVIAQCERLAVDLKKQEGK